MQYGAINERTKRENSFQPWLHFQCRIKSSIQYTVQYNTIELQGKKRRARDSEMKFDEKKNGGKMSRHRRYFIFFSSKTAQEWREKKKKFGRIFFLLIFG